MKPLRPLLSVVLALVLVLLLVPALPTPLYGAPPETCGVWRWGVKTLSDANADDVDFEPQATTVGTLRALDPPRLRSNTPRIRPTEYRTYRIRARVLHDKWVCCREKDDGDYHLVLADPRNRRGTLIAEISDPECPGARDSAKVSALHRVRRDYDNLVRTPPKGRFRTFQDPPLLFVTGVGFFDEVHGQKGVAPNGIELHPVLDVKSAP